MGFYDSPLSHNYLVKDLKPIDKNIKIINFYDNGIVFFGVQKDIPKMWLTSRVLVFTDYPTHIEIMV